MKNVGLNKNSMCITPQRAEREKQIITERLSCLLNGKNRGAGESCTENEYRELSEALAKKKKNGQKQSKLFNFSHWWYSNFYPE